MDKKTLSVIIVSWNVEELLKDCIESIYSQSKNLDFEIIVVDNNSGDNTVAMIQEKFPEVILIANDKNVGFAQANNQGLLKSSGEYVLALNPDTIIKKNALEIMANFMRNNPKVGIAGCKHLNPNLTLQHSIRRFPNIFVILLLLTKIAHILPNLKIMRRYLAKDFDYRVTQVVDQVAGSFFMIRRSLLDKIGLFDPGYFIWFEEVDMCKRAKNAGWEVWYNHSAHIIHCGGQSFKQQLTFKKQGMFFKSALYYLKKHGLL